MTQSGTEFGINFSRVLEGDGEEEGYVLFNSSVQLRGMLGDVRSDGCSAKRSRIS